MPNQEQIVIANGSKSFYMASLFFSKPVKEGAWKLYRWCRYCDDQIDFAKSTEEAKARLDALHETTTQALGETKLNSKSLTPEFAALSSICKQYQIPPRYPLDLLQGFAMDVSGSNYETLEDVEVYAYHVAGVVGLMMTRIFGTSSERAARHAIDLGVAMQLTNIARDIHEDHALGRIYLPQLWLREAQLHQEELCFPKNETKLRTLVVKLLARADSLYRSSYEGLQYLPLRAALAVSIAGSIYSYIGKKVLKNSNATARVYVTTPEKVFLAIHGALRILPIMFQRIGTPWKAYSVSTIGVHDEVSG